MLLKYFYDQALAHASYLVGCQKTGEAILVDPDRNVTRYLAMAKREKMRIVGTLETHIHADYVSGSRELAEQTGAKIYASDEGPADWKYTYVQVYDHQLLKDGDTFHIGNIKMEVMHTPGHTPESISFVLTDLGGGADRPMGLFTGDFVFVGSTGRPDLLEEAAGQAGTAEPGARDLYRSIQKFLQLPDYLQIWPSHGAGSACGKGLGAVPSSTVGYEKLFNEALQFQTEDEFVEYILKDQPEAPPYFAIMKSVNKHGPKVIGEQGLPAKMEMAELAETVANHRVIDTRTSPDFAAQHVEGSLSVPLKHLASQGGWFINYEKPLYVIAGSATIEEVTRVLREIGVDTLAGYFDIDEIVKAGLATESFEDKTPQELAPQIESGEVTLIDVRRRAEWNVERIPGANYVFLGCIEDTTSELNDEKPLVLQCRGGVRSTIAASILQAAGLKNVINLSGGIERWKRDGLPVEKDTPQPVG